MFIVSVKQLEKISNVDYIRIFPPLIRYENQKFASPIFFKNGCLGSNLVSSYRDSNTKIDRSEKLIGN